jgi:hypothetical protein
MNVSKDVVLIDLRRIEGKGGLGFEAHDAIRQAIAFIQAPPADKSVTKPLIGQRLIYGEHEIVTAIRPSKHAIGDNEKGRQWVKRIDGVECNVDIENLHELPNGQL